MLNPCRLVLTATSAIYIITGHNIFRHRNALRSFTRSPPSQVEVVHNPFTSDNLANIERVTKIEVTTEKIEPDRTVVSDSGNDSKLRYREFLLVLLPTDRQIEPAIEVP